MIITYTYTDPIIDQVPDTFIWGLEVDKNYQDVGNRKSLNSLFKDCQINPPSYLLVRSLHELGDTCAEVISAIAFIESLKIEIIAIDQPYNSSKFKHINEEEKKHQLTNIWQEVEKTIKSRKQKKGHSHNRLKALPPPGPSPYGYQKGKESYILNRSSAPIVKDFFERFLLYASLRDSVRYLEQKYNKKIAYSTALSWLKNPVYRGDLASKNRSIVANTHTPIISREEAAQVDRLLKSHRRFKPRSTTASHCLAGLVRCQICGSLCKVNSVNQRNKKRQYLYLTPIKCGQKKSCPSWQYQNILDLTIKTICTELPIIVKKIKTPDVNVIGQNIRQILAEKKLILKDLPNLVEREILDQETALIRSYKLQNDIVELSEKLNQLPPDNLKEMINNLAIAQFWYDLSEPERRFYLREFIKQIYVIPDLNQPKQYQLKLDFIF